MLVAYAKIALKPRPHRRPRCPTTRGSDATLRDVLPDAAARAVRRPARRAPAAPGDRHHRAGQRHGQPRRHHLRLPGRGGDRRVGAEQVARAYVVVPRGLRPAPASSREVEALDNQVSTGAQTALYLEFRRLLDRVGALVPAARRPPTRRRRPRSRGSRPGGRRARAAAARAARRRRARDGCSADAEELVAAGRSRGARAARRPACSTSSRCSTSPRSPRPPARRPPRWRRVYFTLSERFGVDATARPDHRAAARRPLGRAGPGGAALRPVRRAGGAHRRGAPSDPEARAAATGSTRGRRPTRRRCSGRGRRWRRSRSWSSSGHRRRCRSPCARCGVSSAGDGADRRGAATARLRSRRCRRSTTWSATHTELGAPDVEWLHLLVGDWQLLSDLSFADLVLWVPTATAERLGGRSRTCRPDHRPDGVLRRPGRHPRRRAAGGRSSTRPSTSAGSCRERDPDWRDDVPVREEAIPVVRAGRADRGAHAAHQPGRRPGRRAGWS